MLLTGTPDGITPYVLAMREPGDVGLHGPGSVSWRVLSHPATLLGGVRALALQTLDAPTVAGVSAHSRFRDDPIGRLQATARFVTICAFASTEQVKAECEVVNRVHRHVRGSTADGRPYSATDPLQLRFVHLALVDSFLAAYQLCAPTPLEPAEQDQFIREQNRIAPLLGFDSVPLPRSRAELDALLAEHEARFEVTGDTVEALVFLSHPPLPRPMRAGYRLLFAAALASLPPAAQELTSKVRPPLPAAVATAVCRHLIRALGMLLGPSPAYRAALSRPEA
jgi:uncharacterized protein (DUF2236 family)